MNLIVKISNLFYHFKCRYISKYTTVKAKSLRDNVYHPRCRVLYHIIFQVLSDSINNVNNKELIRINFWWKNIFQPQSKILLDSLLSGKQESGQLMKTLEKSNTLVSDLKTNLHYLVDHMEDLI